MKRRRFLRALLGAGSATAAAAALGRRREPELQAASRAAPSGYRETDHVRRYYDTARVR